MKSHLSIVILALFVLSSVPILAPAQPPPVSASCRITCTVADIAEWSDTDFPPIELADLTNETSRVSGSASLVLYTNGDVTITADNSDTAQLTKDASHKLFTEYMLEYDTAGAAQAGGTVVWTDHDSFLSEASTIDHIPGDGAVEVTLTVRAAYDRNAPPASGKYTATQTLTVCWKS